MIIAVSSFAKRQLAPSPDFGNLVVPIRGISTAAWCPFGIEWNIIVAQVVLEVVLQPKEKERSAIVALEIEETGIACDYNP